MGGESGSGNVMPAKNRELSRQGLHGEGKGVLGSSRGGKGQRSSRNGKGKGRRNGKRESSNDYTDPSSVDYGALGDALGGMDELLPLLKEKLTPALSKLKKQLAPFL